MSYSGLTFFIAADRQQRHIALMLCAWGMAFLMAGSSVSGAPPIPVLNSLFPAGGKAGTQVDVIVAGNLTGATGVRCSHPGIVAESAGPNQFRITIPNSIPVGQYDLQVITPFGLSSPRVFTVGNRDELLEAEPNNTPEAPQSVVLNQVVHGKIDRGDLDFFSFSAAQGQRVVIACEAEQIDSRLRGVLELYDAHGHRLAVNRGWQGIDPLLDVTIPSAGIYTVRVADLVYSGSPEHFYRLSIDAGPRVAFAVPCVIERGKTTPVTLFGWNLGGQQADRKSSNGQAPLESITVDITPPARSDVQGLRLRARQVDVAGFAYRYPPAPVPIFMGLSDVPVKQDQGEHQAPGTAQTVPFPSEISGQLIEGEETDWYAVDLKRGEVLWIEAFGERLGSEVDLDVSLFDPTGETELARYRDTFRVPDLPQFSTSHTDPVGRFVAPADGRFLIVVRNLLGSLDADSRRIYRLSLRREESDLSLVVVPRADTPRGLTVPVGGRLVVDLLAFRSRGMAESIKVSATDLPVGVTCPDVWLGPGVESVPLVITANDEVAPLIDVLQLLGTADSVQGARPVSVGVVAQKAPTGISSRISPVTTFAVAGESPIRITANAHEPQPNDLYGELPAFHAPGCVVDVKIRVDRSDIDHLAPVELMGSGLPPLVENQTAVIPAGENQGVISFYLPPTLPVGKYSFLVQGETTVPVGPQPATGERKTETVTVVSNTVTIDVQPAAYVVSIDPFAPRKIRRGEIVKLNYSARRINGFISKIHTELEAPGGVIGLRGRGVTFVGGGETGTIQIIASDDAPLGAQPFLRLNAVGTLEDQPKFRGSCFLHLEIVE